jgi:8-oxo-dGTP pyrophosphatase MutT (NUDIX family)
VVREIGEETGWQVTAGPLLDCWQYHIGAGQDVLIVTYGCYLLSTAPPVVSYEHKRAGLFAPAAIPELVMPDGYKRSIATWLAYLGNAS